MHTAQVPTYTHQGGHVDTRHSIAQTYSVLIKILLCEGLSAVVQTLSIVHTYRSFRYALRMSYFITSQFLLVFNQNKRFSKYFQIPNPELAEVSWQCTFKVIIITETYLETTSQMKTEDSLWTSCRIQFNYNSDV